VECSAVVLGSGALNPFVAGWIGRATLSVKKHETIVILSVGVAARCSTAIPVTPEKWIERPAVIARGVAATKVALSLNGAKLCRTNEESAMLLIVGWAENVVGTPASEMEDGLGVLLCRRSLKPQSRLVRVHVG
jgi:hypothetical protein